MDSLCRILLFAQLSFRFLLFQRVRRILTDRGFLFLFSLASICHNLCVVSNVSSKCICAHILEICLGRYDPNFSCEVCLSVIITAMA